MGSEAESSVIPICPWKCLGDGSEMAKTTKEVRRETFVEKVRGTLPPEIDVANLPSPGLRGNIPTIRLPKRAVERGLQYCKYSLVGRLDLKILKLDALRKAATDLWHPKGDWKIVPLGRGFFMIRLTCEEDFQRIWGKSTWKIENQVLRLTRWDPDFDPDIQRSSLAMIWVKFPKLRQQFWDSECLMAMGKALGAPIGIDKHTTERDYGNYASVLVEIDLAKPIPNQLLVEVDKGEEFLQEVVLGKVPEFCSHCKAVGHTVANCNGLQRLRGETLTEAGEKRPVIVSLPARNTEANQNHLNNKRLRNQRRNKSRAELRRKAAIASKEVVAAASGQECAAGEEGHCQGIPIVVESGGEAPKSGDVHVSAIFSGSSLEMDMPVLACSNTEIPAASCTSWEEIYEKGLRRKKKQITVDAALGSEMSVSYSDDDLNQSCSGESSIQLVGVLNLKEMLREEQASCASASLPEGISRGKKILIDGDYVDGLTLFKMLTPPPRTKVSKLAYRYWTNLVARPLLVKMNEAGLEIDLNLFGVDNWEV